jgi:Flp pilus assembly protein TadD
MMRFPLLVLLAALLCLFSRVPTARADSRDPGEIFLTAYMSAQEAEKLESQGNLKSAQAKYRFAGSILDQLQQRTPDWQPLVVEFRRKKVAEALQKLEERIAAEAPTPAPTAQPGLDPNLLPGINEPQTATAPAAAPDGDAFDRAAREMRAQMAAIKQQLEASREQLQNAQREKERIASKLEEATGKLDTATRISKQQAEQIRKAQADKEEIAKAGAEQAQLQEAALRKQLAKSQESEAALKAQLQRVTAEASSTKSKIEQNQNAQQNLQTQLDEAKAEAAKAKAQLSHAQASESDLQTKLEETRKALETKSQEKAKAAAAETEALKKQMEQLRSALEDAKADREVAEEQGQLIYKRTAKLAQDRADAVNRSQQLGAELEEARKKADALTETQAKLAQVTQERDATEAKNVQLSGELQVANQKIESLADVEQKLIAAAKERESAKAQAAEATEKLAQSQKTIVAVTAERDDALHQLAQARQEKGKVDQLLAENAALMAKLDEAQKTIATLGNSSGSEKDQQIAALKTQLSSVQDQLEATKKEGINHRILIADLQTQLDESTALAKIPATEEGKKLTQENELLRGIVLRELKEQARREQARKLVLGELDRLKIRSQTMSSQIDLLSAPAVKLTDAERALFKAPQMEIIDNTPGAMAISITAPSSGSPDPAKPEQEAPAKAAPKTGSVEGDLPTRGAPSGTPAKDLDSSPKVAHENRPPVPPQLEALAKEAKEKFNQGKYLAAERVYEKMVSLAPGNIYALSNLGVARYRAGHFKLAEETLKKVLALEPGDSFARSTLGIVYFQQGKYDESVTALTQSVAVNPKSALAHNFLGIAAAAKGWPEAALKELETAVQIDPNYPEARYNLAVALADAQPPKKEEARRHYKKALELGMEPNPTFEATLK